jgi:hypothetical protein
MAMQMSRKLKLIELFGPPGAGKSSLARASAQGAGLLSRQDLGLTWRRQSFARKARFVVKAYVRSECAARALRLAWNAPLRSPEALVRLARLLVKAEWMKAQAGIVLLDQGPLQELWSILYSSGVGTPDPDLVSPFVKSLYSGSEPLIVYIRVDPSIASARIRGRSHGHSRLDGLNRDELEESLARGAELPERIAAAARAAGLKVQTMDGSKPLEVLVSQLAPRLEPPD